MSRGGVRGLLLSIVLLSGLTACDKKLPAANLEVLRSALQCPPANDDDGNRERCRIFGEFAKAGPFDTWPTDGKTAVWLGRSFCVDETASYPSVLHIKAGKADPRVVRTNHFDGVALVPYVVNDDDLPFSALLRKGVSKGPPFSVPVMAAARKPQGGVYFPIARSEDGVRSPSSDWRAKGDRLLVVTPTTECAAELWKLP